MPIYCEAYEAQAMKSIFVSIFMVVLFGCALHGQKPKPAIPNPMPLSDSVLEVMKALDHLATMRDSTKPFHGLLPAEVEVVFQLEAIEKDQGSFSLGVLSLGKFSTEWSGDMTQAGNTITIRFRNIAFSKTDELLGANPNLLPDAVKTTKKHLAPSR